MKNIIIMFYLCLQGFYLMAQKNPIFIPQALTGKNFDLNIQEGTTQFTAGINTTTYGINGKILAPTIIVNKGDSITLNVTNNLTGTGNSTTIHWHGLHVSPQNDGGPHQIISQGTTWRPSFKVRNDAGTYWYHPHGEMKTDRHVSKGLAGFFIVKDSIESALTLPRTYGIDDIPLVIQTKALDILNQIAVSTEDDTLVCVNGTPRAYFNAPAQVIRLRLLNGSSMRAFNVGFSNNINFKVIASDGGLLDSAITMNRILIMSGERYEILVDLQPYLNDTLQLMSYASTIPNNVYGAKTVQSMMGSKIPEYDQNPLNGKDYNLMQINVGAKTSIPILSMPTTLNTNIIWNTSSINKSRTIQLKPDTMGMGSGMVAGPFNIDGRKFDMDVINQTVYLNNVEKWKIDNQTGIAHPFHIHDIQFYILNVNGGAVPLQMRGKKDVVQVMPGQYVEFITKFETFADSNVPYMYHCHLLHHEDDGMMGSFKVIDTSSKQSSISQLGFKDGIQIYPNPFSNQLSIKSDKKIQQAILTNLEGKRIKEICTSFDIVNLQDLDKGIYFIQVNTNEKNQTFKLIKE